MSDATYTELLIVSMLIEYCIYITQGLSTLYDVVKDDKNVNILSYSHKQYLQFKVN